MKGGDNKGREDIEKKVEIEIEKKQGSHSYGSQGKKKIFKLNLNMLKKRMNE